MINLTHHSTIYFRINTDDILAFFNKMKPPFAPLAPTAPIGPIVYLLLFF